MTVIRMHYSIMHVYEIMKELILFQNHKSKNVYIESMHKNENLNVYILSI